MLLERTQRRAVIAGFLALATLATLAALSAPAAARPKARKASPASPPSAASESPSVEPPPLEPAEPAPAPAQPTPPAAAATQASPSADPARVAGSKPPSPEPVPRAQPEPAATDPEQLASLQSELGFLMDDLVQARTRAALVGKTLWKTLIRVRVQNLAGDQANLARIVLKLDGAPIYRGDAGSIRGDEAQQVFEGYLAPGPHVLSAEIEQNSRDSAAYGYSLRDAYRFAAVREKRNELTLILNDDSDIESESADEQDGEYDIRTRLRARTKDLKDE